MIPTKYLKNCVSNLSGDKVDVDKCRALTQRVNMPRIRTNSIRTKMLFMHSRHLTWHLTKRHHFFGIFLRVCIFSFIHAGPVSVRLLLSFALTHIIRGFKLSEKGTRLEPRQFVYWLRRSYAGSGWDDKVNKAFYLPELRCFGVMQELKTWYNYYSLGEECFWWWKFADNQMISIFVW